MKILAACALALLAAFPAVAQDPGAERERERIRAQRAAAETRFADAKRACNARFAVNDCVDRASRAHNAELADLRRQERALNDAERRQRAAERLRAQEERRAAEADQAAAERRARAVAKQQEREAQAAEKLRRQAEEQARRAQNPRVPKEPSGPPQPQGSARAPQGPKGPAITAEEAARNRAAHEARVREAQQHKAEVQQRMATRSKPAASGLPVPP